MITLSGGDAGTSDAVRRGLTFDNASDSGDGSHDRVMSDVEDYGAGGAVMEAGSTSEAGDSDGSENKGLEESCSGDEAWEDAEEEGTAESSEDEESDSEEEEDDVNDYAEASDDDDDDEQAEASPGMITRALDFILSARVPAATRDANLLSRFPRLPIPPCPLKHELAWELENATCSSSLKRQRSLPTSTSEQGVPKLAAGGRSRCCKAASSKQAARPEAAAAPPVANTADLLLQRDLGVGSRPGFSRGQQRHLNLGRPSTCPMYPQRRVDSVDERAYIGQYSQDGTFFVAAFQDQRVRLYDVDRGWRLRKDVRAKMCRWTVTDTCLSPDGRFLIYASITPVAHLVAVGSHWDGIVESISNITEVHEALAFDERAEDWHLRREFGIWSIKWSGDGREIIAGTNNEKVYIYDFETSRVVAFVDGHSDDVNAVAYLDESPNLIASGSDDSFVKVWDRRMLDQRGRCQPVGVLVGHTEGLTHLDSKGDGRYLISNCKDQSIKLWDLRSSLVSEHQAQEDSKGPSIPRFRWDYRWMQYPGAAHAVKHPHDHSIATFRGHEVRQTLIRAYFSPKHTTGQRYIYSGGMDGSVRMWDIVTGEMVRELRHHRTLVRDCSWHPYLPNLTTVSWDGSVVEWGPQDGQRLPSPGADPMEDFY